MRFSLYLAAASPWVFVGGFAYQLMQRTSDISPFWLLAWVTPALYLSLARRGEFARAAAEVPELNGKLRTLGFEVIGACGMTLLAAVTLFAKSDNVVFILAAWLAGPRTWFLTFAPAIAFFHLIQFNGVARRLTWLRRAVAICAFLVLLCGMMLPALGANAGGPQVPRWILTVAMVVIGVTFVSMLGTLFAATIFLAEAASTLRRNENN